MKKVINGKRYNTNAATLIASWTNGLSANDFNVCAERLYRKRTGEYFLHGEGGASSKYGHKYADGWGYGEAVKPLTIAQAKEWAEEHLGGDEYEKIFGPVEEGLEKKAFSIRLTHAAVAKLKDMAADSGRSMSDVIEKLITGA